MDTFTLIYRRLRFMHRIFLTPVILIVSPLSFLAQVYEGVVLDALSGEPIPYASVLYEDQKNAVNTNELGEFVITSSTSVALVRSIGYTSASVELDSMETTRILLTRKEVELAEVVISRPGESQETAREVMFKVFENLRKNYTSEKTEYKAFYRHYCKEDTAYGRLIEAALTIYDPKGHAHIAGHPKNKVQVRVDQIRRSFDYTKNFDDHDPISIYSTLKYDVTSYASIHIAVPEEHNYRFLDTTYYDGQWVYVIGYNYQYIKQHKRPVEFNNTGKIYVNTEDYAILKIEEHQAAKREDIFILYTYDLNWEVNYTMINGKYHLTYAKESGYNKDYYSNNEGQLLYTKDHLFHVEIMINGINDVQPEAFKGVEPSKKQLDKMNYHPEFWRTFPVLKDSPLNEQIIRDLEKQQSLEEQYKKEN